MANNKSETLYSTSISSGFEPIAAKYGVISTPVVEPIVAKYGVIPTPVVEPIVAKYGVIPTPVSEPVVAKYGVVPTPVSEPVVAKYGVIPTPVSEPVVAKYGVVPTTDINITYKQLEENISSLKEAISGLKSSWQDGTKDTLNRIQNSWVGEDCAAYTSKLTGMDKKVNNTISALELLCNAYEDARGMVKDNQSKTISSINSIN